MTGAPCISQWVSSCITQKWNDSMTVVFFLLDLYTYKLLYQRLKKKKKEETSTSYFSVPPGISIETTLCKLPTKYQKQISQCCKLMVSVNLWGCDSDSTLSWTTMCKHVNPKLLSSQSYLLSNFYQCGTTLLQQELLDSVFLWLSVSDIISNGLPSDDALISDVKWWL